MGLDKNRDKRMEFGMEQNEIRKKIKKALDKGRYEHTRGVMYTAGCLAMAHGCSVEKAMLAGLLHDCAKCIPNDEKLKLCKKNNIVVNEVERQSPYLLHAKLGAYLAETEYGIKDPEVLHAIRVHTTGAADMSLLDKIVFIADYIEPGRSKATNLPQIRQVAFRDLDECLLMILHDTLKYESGRGSALDPATQIAYEYYKQYRKGESKA